MTLFSVCVPHHESKTFFPFGKCVHYRSEFVQVSSFEGKY